MSTPATLPISRLVRVTVTLGAVAAQSQNLSTLLILADSDVIDSQERIRFYDELSGVAADFDATSPEYLASVLWFEQVPKPVKVALGRWVKTASKGKLVGGPLSVTLAEWTAITDGAFDVTIDGVLKHVTGLDFHLDTNFNAIAATINADLTPGASIIWNAVYNRFEIESATTGALSSVSVLAPPAAGTDVSDMMAGTTILGARSVAGLAAETALAAATLMDNNFGQKWYAMILAAATPPSDVDQTSVAQFIESTGTKHIFGVTDTDADVIIPGETTSLAHQLFVLNLNRTMTQYSSSNPFAICSALGRLLTVDFNANSSIITLMYKQEPGIVAENLTETQIDAIESKNCNVFVNYNNDTAIIERGTVVSGQYVDTITGVDWLAITIQTALYNVLLTSPNKIGQSDQGMHILTTTVEAVCAQGVNNGLLAPGVWNNAGFGQLRTGDLMAKGFYVYASSVALQDDADRGARISVPIQVAAKLAGAIHTADVSITVNQ